MELLIKILVIWAIGSLISFGIAYSLSSGDLFDEEEMGMSKAHFRKWAFISSWFAVFAFLQGFIRGFKKGGKDV